jgi:hypothetical protein
MNDEDRFEQLLRGESMSKIKELWGKFSDAFKGSPLILILISFTAGALIF